MPVYVRKNLVITPPSLSQLSDDDEDYLTDPDQLRDRLPQPFRMVNKIIYGFFDEVWELIHERETARLAEAARIRPPQYECAIQMQLHGQGTCLTKSPDGRYIFVGLPDGLAAIDAMTQQTLGTWEETGVEITHIQAVMFGVQTYLLSTIDDMGSGRLFAFANDRFNILKYLNEHDNETKTLISKVQASNEGDYAGVVVENPSTKECWIEFSKLPRDAWLRELESIQAEYLKKQNRGGAGTPSVKPPKSRSSVKDDDSTVQVDAEDKVSSPVPEETSKEPAEETQSVGGRSQSARSTRTSSSRSLKLPSARSRGVSPGSARASPGPPGSDKSAHKFTAPTLVLRVKPPPPITGCFATTPLQAAQKVDLGDVIGSGINHSITPHHLEQRKAVFEHFHEQYLKYLPKEKEEATPQPMFHFLEAGRMLPSGLEQATQEGKPSSVGIWWVGGTQIFYYSLVKSSKDFEHKPDFISPQSSIITSSAVSPCTSLLAVALQSGIVIIWDLHIGLQRRVLSVTKNSTILKVTFLEPSICPQEEDEYPPYPTKTSAYLMIWCSDGTVQLLNCAMGCKEYPIQITSEIEDEDQLPTMIEPFAGIPEVILLVRRNGTAFLLDVTKGNTIPLCEIVLPKTHELTQPWDPIMAVGADGLMLYLKANQKDPGEDYVPNSGMSSLFVFQLRSFPSLDKYWRRERKAVPYVVHSTVDKRIDALLRERITTQPFRQARMQQRWAGLKDELEMIKRIQEANRKRAGLRSPFWDEESESSIARTPLLD